MSKSSVNNDDTQSDIDSTDDNNEWKVSSNIIILDSTQHL